MFGLAERTVLNVLLVGLEVGFAKISALQDVLIVGCTEVDHFLKVLIALIERGEEILFFKVHWFEFKFIISVRMMKI